MFPMCKDEFCLILIKRILILFECLLLAFKNITLKEKILNI